MSESVPETILLNPGPVTLTHGVRVAAMAADHCHREPEFLAIQAEVLTGLLRVYGVNAEAWRAVTLGGSGTTAMEAMLCSLLPAEARLLVLENGVYGERLARIAEVHGIAFASLRKPWGAAVPLDEVEAQLADGGFTHLAMVHHETTTGRLNPAAEVAELCERHGVQMLLDSVSSFGAEALPLGNPALVACAGTANKCLHGIPGLAFVLARPKVLLGGAPRRSLVLHLPDWAVQQDRGGTPFTPPTHAFLALRQALVELEAGGGWRSRQARYLALAERVRACLARCGVEPWLSPQESSCVLRSYRLPEGFSYARVHDDLRAHGFVIYAGQGGLAGEMFRVSTMGQIRDPDLQRLEAAFEHVFRSTS